MAIKKDPYEMKKNFGNPAHENKKILLQASHLVKEFVIPASGFGKPPEIVHALSDVSIDIYEGETLALVGESGCGKSTLGRLLLRLIEPTTGDIMFDGQKILALNEREMMAIRRQIQIVFQDPYASINPRMNVYQIIKEPLTTHKIYKSEQEIKARVEELLKEVGIRPEYLYRYPHQFSGGQRQRIGVARALALNPKLIVCDEPVSALDVSIQAQIINLLHDLQTEYHLTYLFISHDLSVVKYISDRICVMFLGKLCEVGKTEDIFKSPIHPYTKLLMEAVPKPDPHLRKEAKETIQGEIPSPVNPPGGCRFHTRCPFSEPICEKEEPLLREVHHRMVACHLAARFVP